MAYPTDLDSFTNPEGTDKVSEEIGGRTHSKMHSDTFDALEALEAKLGIDSSVISTSHDYKLSGVTGTDVAASLTGEEELTNKTITSAKLKTSLNDVNGNELIRPGATADAVNDITITNAITGEDPLISGSGGDENVSFMLKGKGTGKVKLGDDELKWPDSDGVNTQVLTTDGSGTLSFEDQAGAATALTVFPTQPILSDGSIASRQLNDNTKMLLSMVKIPFYITASKITIQISTFSSAGKLKLAIYSEDGQTQHLEHITDTISEGSQSVTESLAESVELSPGMYYSAVLPMTSTDYWPFFEKHGDSVCDLDIYGGVTGEPIIAGYITTSANEMPSTFDPTTDLTTQNAYHSILMRLDA